MDRQLAISDGAGPMTVTVSNELSSWQHNTNVDNTGNLRRSVRTTSGSLRPERFS